MDKLPVPMPPPGEMLRRRIRKRKREKRLQCLILCIFMVLLIGGMLVMTADAADAFMEIPVSVMVEGSEPDWNAVYTVELVAEDASCPMPEGSHKGVYRMAIKGGSTGSICLTPGNPGEYTYILRQIPGKELDCTYDERQFQLRVTDDGASLRAMVFDSGGEPLTDIAFENRWAEPAWVTLSAQSTLDGGTPESGLFTCVLIGEDGSIIVETGNQGRRIQFPPLRFKQEGAFRCEMIQRAEYGKGIQCDRGVYTITVTVHKEGDYRAETVISRNGKPCEGLPEFANHTEGGSPKTGDPIGLWAAGAALSLIALLSVYSRYRNKKA